MQSFYIARDPGFTGHFRDAFPEAKSCAYSAFQELNDPSLIWVVITNNRQFQQCLEMLSQNQHHRIVVLSNEPTAGQAMAAFKAGARGYCHVQAVPELLKQAASVVRNNGIWVSAEFMPSLLQAIGAAVDQSRSVDGMTDAGADIDSLTGRELEVVALVCDGLSNKEIARELSITERTVKSHLGAVFEKLELRDRVQLVIRLKPLLID